MQDRRASARRRETASARIVFNGRKAGCDCVVHDFSPKGARVGITGRDRVPDEFELYMPSKQKAFPARVRWRRQNELGLVFTDKLESSEAQASTNELLKRIEKLESQIVTLNREVRSLTAEVARVLL